MLVDPVAKPMIFRLLARAVSSHSSARSGVPTSFIMSMTASLAPPCSGPLSAPMAPARRCRDRPGWTDSEGGGVEAVLSVRDQGSLERGSNGAPRPRSAWSARRRAVPGRRRSRRLRCRPSKPCRSISIALSGLNAPGHRSSFPEVSPARNAARFSPAGVALCSIRNSPALLSARRLGRCQAG